MPEWRVDRGDCRPLMHALPADSVDSMVTDPPYGLGFMGAEWDKFGKGGMKAETIAAQKARETRNEPFGRSGKAAAPSPGEKESFMAFMGEVAAGALHALKPGAHALVFGGTRTYHWTIGAFEDAGFEVRDQLLWLYGTGFPKSQNLSKTIDKANGVKPIEKRPATLGMANDPNWNSLKTQLVMPPPTTPDAVRWAGWGTALKPCYEPFALLRKPIKGPTYRNVLEHGTGGLNLAACSNGERVAGNVLIDEHVAAALEGKARYFYCPKPGKAEKEAGLEGFDAVNAAALTGRKEGSAGLVMQHADGRPKANPYAGTSGAEPRKNTHPTVKPVRLLRWMARLVTPPGGTLLDPFCGSGSAGIAACLEGFNYVGIELDPEDKRFDEIARARILHWCGPSVASYYDPVLEGF